MSKGKEQKQIARERRLQAALRENLRRRKAQARGRVSSPDKAAAQGEEGGQPPGKPDNRERSGR
jgi:hypothetical protein